MHSDYIIPSLRELRDQQVRFATRDKKIEQAERAERLLGELEPGRTYTYEYVCLRITKSRPEPCPAARFSGRDASHDLRLFIEDLSDAANVSADAAGEPVVTVDELSKRFNVSTKTISRWRRHGLVSRRFVVGGHKRLGFLASSVDRFVRQNPELVHRGAESSQLTEEERQKIIDQARRLARAGGCPADVAKQFARLTDRSVKTIRYTLKQFDADNPDVVISTDESGPLEQETKQRIYEQYRRGESAEALAKEFCRTKTGIYRIVGEMRAKRIMELPLDYMPNELFARLRSEEQEKEIMGPMPPNDQPVKKSRLPSGVPPSLASLYEIPLLTREQEQHLFRKMNYLKYKASKLREALDPSRPRSGLMDQIEGLYADSIATKEEIISANLRLVISIANQLAEPGEDFLELVRGGKMSLSRAAEKFDFARGNKFSTYASWAIMRGFRC